MESINSIHFYCVLTMGAKLKKDRVAKRVPPEDESMGNLIFLRIFYHVFCGNFYFSKNLLSCFHCSYWEHVHYYTLGRRPH
jgi:hypothetical protein